MSAIKKLNDMKSVVAYPKEYMNDSLIDEYYNNLELLSDQYLQNMLNIKRFNRHRAIRKLREPVIDKDNWIGNFIPIVNAFYNSLFNKIGNEKFEITRLIVHSINTSLRT